MRTPIAHALGWPARIDSGVSPLDLLARGQLNFEAPDPVRFPCLRLARDAAEAGGTAAAVLNAANEEAVAAFLAGAVGFTDIPDIIAAALMDTPLVPASSLDVVHEADRAGRIAAQKLIRRRSV
jgi:1-deoxy-D-xylulose-5-phosphate reductoisomerase